MAHSKREIKPGRAHTKVAGDDEMLRTGFVDGTPLEGGKIADSQPVDLFAAARRVADPYSQQQQQQKKEQQGADEGTTTTNKQKNVVKAAESEPVVDLHASAPPGVVAEANPAAAATATETETEQQGAGGRRSGVGRLTARNNNTLCGFH